VAYLRKQRRSPFWYLVRKDFDSGEWEGKTTGLRIDNESDTRQAHKLAEKATAEEQRLGTAKNSPAFVLWVPEFITVHSTRRYRSAWFALRLFLEQEGVTYPRQIRYEHGAAYIKWRLVNPVHGRAVQHNSALLEVKFLSQLMGEAIRREYCERNPLANLRIGKTPQKEKPELSDNEINILWQALQKQPEWMRIAFQIALYTGCRFSECAIPLSEIDFVNWTARIRDAKRSEHDIRKFFTVPIDPPLRPILLDLKKRGATVTCSLSEDKNGRINKVFRKAGVDASFHSLRVTFVTRLHRSGASMPEAMKLVNHSQMLIHRVYSRLTVEDVRKARARVRLPVLK
jgi:integrase